MSSINVFNCCRGCLKETPPEDKYDLKAVTNIKLKVYISEEFDINVSKEHASV